jgi:hypothetical protein
MPQPKGFSNLPFGKTQGSCQWQKTWVLIRRESFWSESIFRSAKWRIFVQRSTRRTADIANIHFLSNICDENKKFLWGLVKSREL